MLQKVEILCAHNIIKANDVCNLTLSDAALSGSLVCLKYAHNVILANDAHNNTLSNAAKSGNIACIEYCKKHFSL